MDGTIVLGGGFRSGIRCIRKVLYLIYGGGYDAWVNRPAMDAGTFVHIGLDPVAASPVIIARLKQEYSNIDPALISDPAPGTASGPDGVNLSETICPEI